MLQVSFIRMPLEIKIVRNHSSKYKINILNISQMFIKAIASFSINGTFLGS